MNTIAIDQTLEYNFTLDSDKTITVNLTKSFSIDSNITLTNNGTISNNGTIILRIGSVLTTSKTNNQNTITNTKYIIDQNTDTTKGLQNGYINNTGNLLTNSLVTVSSGNAVNRIAVDQILPVSFTLNSGKLITVNSTKTLTIYSEATLTNNGFVVDLGTLTNNGTINNTGNILSNSSITVSSGNAVNTIAINQTLEDNFTLNSDKLITVNPTKTLTIDGNVTLTNNGTISNNGSVTINLNGILTNSAFVVSKGTITNNGTLANNGNILSNNSITVSSGNALNTIAIDQILLVDFIINPGTVVLIDNGKLTINENVYLVNNGTINETVVGAAEIINNGFILESVDNISNTIFNGTDIYNYGNIITNYGNPEVDVNDGNPKNTIGIDQILKYDFTQNDANGNVEIIIDSGKKLTIDSNVTLTINDELTNNGELEINGTLINNNELINNSIISNNYILTNTEFIVNYHTITNSNILNNSGTILSNSSITVSTGNAINSITKPFTLQHDFTLNNGNRIDIDITNNTQFYILSNKTFTNNGSIHINYGDLAIGGTFINTSIATIEVHETNGALMNSGFIIDSGTISNRNVINYGFILSNSLTNACLLSSSFANINEISEEHGTSNVNYTLPVDFTLNSSLSLIVGKIREGGTSLYRQKLIIPDGKTLTISNSNLVVNGDGIVEISNNGTLVNENFILCRTYSFITNNGTLNNDNGNILAADNNNKNITVTSGNTVNVIAKEGLTIKNNFQSINKITINKNVTISGAKIHNHQSEILINEGVTVECINSGTIDNFGLIVNKGTISTPSTPGTNYIKNEHGQGILSNSNSFTLTTDSNGINIIYDDVHLYTSFHNTTAAGIIEITPNQIFDIRPDVELISGLKIKGIVRNHGTLVSDTTTTFHPYSELMNESTGFILDKGSFDFSNVGTGNYICENTGVIISNTITNSDLTAGFYATPQDAKEVNKIWTDTKLTQDFTLNQNKTITVNSTKTLTIDSNITLETKGGITVNGNITNNGFIIQHNDSSSSIDTSSSGSSITNNGNILSNLSIDNYSGNTINTIAIDQTLNTQYSTYKFINVNASKTFTINGTLTLEIATDEGHIRNEGTVVITENGTITNGGTIINRKILTNNGTLTNNRFIFDYLQGSTSGSATQTTMTNNGTLTNNGNILSNSNVNLTITGNPINTIGIDQRLDQDFTLFSNKVITITVGKTLSIFTPITLTNEGFIVDQNTDSAKGLQRSRGTLINNGDILSNSSTDITSGNELNKISTNRTLDVDFTLNSDKTITVNSTKTLRINSNVTLTNNGTMTVNGFIVDQNTDSTKGLLNNSTLTNYGNILSNSSTTVSSGNALNRIAIDQTLPVNFTINLGLSIDANKTFTIGNGITLTNIGFIVDQNTDSTKGLQRSKGTLINNGDILSNSNTDITSGNELNKISTNRTLDVDFTLNNGKTITVNSTKTFVINESVTLKIDGLIINNSFIVDQNTLTNLGLQRLTNGIITNNGNILSNTVNGQLQAGSNALNTIVLDQQLNANFTINNGKTLTVNNDKTLTIDRDVTLINLGTLLNNGNIVDNNTDTTKGLQHYQNITNNGNILTNNIILMSSSSNQTNIIAVDQTLSVSGFTLNSGKTLTIPLNKRLTIDAGSNSLTNYGFIVDQNTDLSKGLRIMHSARITNYGNIISNTNFDEYVSGRPINSIGDDQTLQEDFTLNHGKTIFIRNLVTLTISENITFINNGTIDILSQGHIVNHGFILCNQNGPTSGSITNNSSDSTTGITNNNTIFCNNFTGTDPRVNAINTVGKDLTLNNDYTNDLTLSIPGIDSNGNTITFTINSGVTLTNNNVIVNEGTVINSGNSIDNSSGVIFSSSNISYIYGNAINKINTNVTLSRNFKLNGNSIVISIPEKDSNGNTITFTIDSGVTLNNNHIILNNGNITINGTLDNSNGIILSNKTINNITGNNYNTINVSRSLDIDFTINKDQVVTIGPGIDFYLKSGAILYNYGYITGPGGTNISIILNNDDTSVISYGIIDQTIFFALNDNSQILFSNNQLGSISGSSLGSPNSTNIFYPDTNNKFVVGTNFPTTVNHNFEILSNFKLNNSSGNYDHNENILDLNDQNLTISSGKTLVVNSEITNSGSGSPTITVNGTIFTNKINSALSSNAGMTANASNIFFPSTSNKFVVGTNFPVTLSDNFLISPTNTLDLNDENLTISSGKTLVVNNEIINSGSGSPIITVNGTIFSNSSLTTYGLTTNTSNIFFPWSNGEFIIGTNFPENLYYNFTLKEGNTLENSYTLTIKPGTLLTNKGFILNRGTITLENPSAMDISEGAILTNNIIQSVDIPQLNKIATNCTLRHNFTSDFNFGGKIPFENCTFTVAPGVVFQSEKELELTNTILQLTGGTTANRVVLVANDGISDEGRLPNTYGPSDAGVAFSTINVDGNTILFATNNLSDTNKFINLPAANADNIFYPEDDTDTTTGIEFAKSTVGTNFPTQLDYNAKINTIEERYVAYEIVVTAPSNTGDPYTFRANMPIWSWSDKLVAGYTLKLIGWNSGENVAYLDSSGAQISNPTNPPSINGDQIITAAGETTDSSNNSHKYFEFQITLANTTNVGKIAPRGGQKILGAGQPDKLFVPAGQTLTIGSSTTFTVAGKLILEPSDGTNPGGQLIV